MKVPPGDLIFKTFDHMLVHRINQKLICPSTAFGQRNRDLKSTFPDHMKILTIVGESFRMLPIYPVTSPPNHLATNGIATKEQTRHQDTVYSPHIRGDLRWSKKQRFKKHFSRSHENFNHSRRVFQNASHLSGHLTTKPSRYKRNSHQGVDSSPRHSLLTSYQRRSQMITPVNQLIVMPGQDT